MNIFPNLWGDEVTFIGSTFLTYGEQKSYLNHCYVVGSCDDIPGAEIESVSSIAKIESVSSIAEIESVSSVAKIESVSSERELSIKWSELIQKEDSDIIIGYHIFGFVMNLSFVVLKKPFVLMNF